MTRKGLWLASAVVVVANAASLGMAALNRQGDPDAVLRLTEREARLVSGGAENTAVSLRLKVTGLGAGGEIGWFDQSKLTALGFDCSVPVTRENLGRYAIRPPRRVYAALEFEGPAWEKYAAGLAPDIDRSSADGVSHLMLIDVDRDAASLRARHPDRTKVAIARAVVGIAIVAEPGRPPRLRGRVHELLSSEVTLPKDVRGAVEPMVGRFAAAGRARPAGAGSGPRAPRYVAAIRWGQRLEPWAESVRMADGGQ